MVPIAPNTEHLWEVDPFSGEIRDGYLYGRGTIDDKGGVVGILSAIEEIITLQPSFVPQRTIYIAFGQDEEVSGAIGAQQIVSYLRDQNIRLEFVLDEGGIILDQLHPITKRSVALVATAEKGSSTLTLKVEANGGHSSMPDSETTIGILASAISRLEATQLPKSFNKAFRDMMEFTSGASNFANRIVTSNLWLFGPIMTMILPSSSNTINASLRTTIAPTVIRAGEKDNVLPKVATCHINFRIIPGETIDTLVRDVSRIINDDRVSISVDWGSNPSPISPSDGFAWSVIQSSISALDSQLIVSPFLGIFHVDSSRILVNKYF